MSELLKLALTFISGALTTALGMYIFLYGKVRDLEAKQDARADKLADEQKHLKDAFELERTRTDSRIFEAVGLVKTIIEMVKEDREERRDLMAEIRAMVKRS